MPPNTSLHYKIENIFAGKVTPKLLKIFIDKWGVLAYMMPNTEDDYDLIHGLDTADVYPVDMSDVPDSLPTGEKVLLMSDYDFNVIGAGSFGTFGDARLMVYPTSTIKTGDVLSLIRDDDERERTVKVIRPVDIGVTRSVFKMFHVSSSTMGPLEPEV